MQKNPASKIEKILFAVIGVLLIAVLAISLFSYNVLNWSHDKREYTVLENYSYEKIESATSPAGVVNEFRFEIPELDHDQTFSFFFNHQNAKVYLDGVCVYSLESDGGLVRTPGCVRPMIPIYMEDSGKELLVVLEPVYKSYQDEIPSFWLGSALAIYQEELYHGLPEVVCSFAVILVGVLLLFIAVYYTVTGANINRLYAISLMTISAGTWRLTYGNLLYVLFEKHSAFIFTLSVISLMMIALCMLNSVDVSGKWKRAVHWVSRGYCAVYITQLLLQVFGVLDLRETLTVVHVAIVISAVTMIVSSIASWCTPASKSHRFVERSFSWILGLGALADLLMFYFGNNSLGMLCFLLSTLIFSLVDGMRVLFLYRKQKRDFEELENQLALSRTMTMMSQIRSHFVFNVLNAISGMCKYDPEMADDTVVCFARYLRNNIDIMEEDKSIPFSKEIAQLEDYVMLEQIRFGDKIEFYTDIETDRFVIPPLILQPIVENAIKHGVSKKMTNGNIILRVREEEGNIIITVEDDGVGFDMAELKKDKSVGLRNIRFRLAQLASGTMDIQSEVGVGTTVTITMPKREE